MIKLIDAEIFKENMDFICDAGGCLEPVTKAVREFVKNHIDGQTVVDAIPIEFIQKRINHLHDLAEYDFEANGGYIGEAHLAEYELENLLTDWRTEQEK